MIDFYVAKIKAGEMTIEEVPTRWREAVQKLLDENT